MSEPSSLPDPHICEQARLSRDARFDGLFFTAVSSTGIYCRPVCPAPTPKRGNVRYYANAAAAEAAGFRPCLRCRPELAPGNDQWQRGDHVVARALKLIEAGMLAEQSLDKRAALVLRLGYRPPYDFAALLTFLRTRALPGVELVEEHSYARVFGPVDAPGWLRLSAWPGGEHALQLQLHCPQPTQLLGVVTTLRRMFDLDANPQAIADTFRHDAILGPSLARHPGLRLPGGWDGFEIAVRAILGQQISVAAARTLATRIVQRWGESLPAAPMPGLERLFPTPAALAQADLREIGLTTTRAATISGMAQALLDGRVDFSAEQSLDEFVARWVALPGIGEWTAHYMAMRALSDPDAFPAADLILRREATTDAAPLGTKALTLRAEAWRPWRAYAVIHLWRGTSDAPAPARAPRRKKPEALA